MSSETSGSSGRLDQLRSQDQISSVGYAIGIAEVWAEHLDAVHPSETGLSHAETVTRLLADTGRIQAAFSSGYEGHDKFPVPASWQIVNEVGNIFHRGIYTRNMGGTQVARSRAIDVVTGEALGVDPTDPKAASDLSFAHRIVGAHGLYQYLDGRVAKKYKMFQGDNGLTRVAPGKEEVFWGAMLFGLPNSPGIFNTQGSIAKLLESITASAEERYGEKAEDFLAAWWATVNMLRGDKETYTGVIRDPLKALIAGDLGTARYLLKERLYSNRELLPYCTRSR